MRGRGIDTTSPSVLEGRPNAGLVGDAQARAGLDTPALLLDLDVLERNIARMADWARSAGVRVRPHVKSHKSLRIARLQRDAGACGFCCATIGEAEMMARAGFTSLLITSPLVTNEKIARALALLILDPDLCLVVDNPANAAHLAELARGAGRAVQVLVDVDPGMQRTGAANRKDAVQLVRDVAADPSLRYAGLQSYAGQVQHITGAEARQEATLAILGGLRVLCEDLIAEALAPGVVSGGGTGSHEIDAAAGVLTELQVGSYVVMDNQYNQVWLGEGRRPPFEPALFVQASVVSNNHPNHVTCDAGLKQFAVDGGSPVVARGAPEGATYTYAGDGHGRLTFPAGSRRPELGERIEFIIPHCDPTVNLYDDYHCVRGETLVDIWPVDARGV